MPPDPPPERLPPRCMTLHSPISIISIPKIWSFYVFLCLSKQILQSNCCCLQAAMILSATSPASVFFLWINSPNLRDSHIEKKQLVLMLLVFFASFTEEFPISHDKAPPLCSFRNPGCNKQTNRNTLDRQWTSRNQTSSNINRWPTNDKLKDKVYEKLMNGWWTLW